MFNFLAFCLLNSLTRPIPDENMAKAITVCTYFVQQLEHDFETSSF